MPNLLLPRPGPAVVDEPFVPNERSGQASGLQLWYPLSANLRGIEVVGGGGPAALQGTAKFVASPERGTVLDLDGTSGCYAVAPNDPRNTFGANDFSVAIWFYKRATTAVFSNIWAISKAVITVNTNTEWDLAIGNGQTGPGEKCSMAVASGSTLTEIQSTAAPALNTWHLLVGLRRGNTLELWIDGASAATPVAFSSTINTVSARTMRIGSWDTNTLQPNAQFSDLRIYNRALLEPEIAEMYAEPTSRLLFRPAAWRVVAVPSVATTIAFRRTLSGLGARVGSRQLQRGG